MSKGLEALKYLAIRYEMPKANQTELNIIEKELKALEIIKNKKVNIKVFMYCLDTGEDYNCIVDNNERELTQEEYDLLKEILK